MCCQLSTGGGAREARATLRAGAIGDDVSEGVEARRGEGEPVLVVCLAFALKTKIPLKQIHAVSQLHGSFVWG